jgi:hypothetical protein
VNRVSQISFADFAQLLAVHAVRTWQKANAYAEAGSGVAKAIEADRRAARVVTLSKKSWFIIDGHVYRQQAARS